MSERTESDEIATTSTALVYENPWMQVREDRIVRSNGQQGLYGYVDKPDFALIVPMENDGFHLVEQFRYPIGRRSLEFPQGTYPNRQAGDVLALAKLELKQETGLQAAELTHVGRLYGAPGMANQAFHVYLATGLTHGERALEPEEVGMTQLWLAKAELEERIRQGQIVDAPSIAAYHLCQMHLAV